MAFEKIILLLTTYKYLLLFPITVVEGPIITVIAGFLSSLGHFNVYLAYIVIVIGDVLGDCIYYAFGYYGRQTFILRWGRFLGITIERAERLEKHFENHSGKTLVIGKFSHGVGGVVLLAAGMARMPFWKFVWYTLLPTFPKSLILLLIGFYFGEAYTRINTYLDYTVLVTIALALMLVTIYFVIKKVSKRYENENQAPTDLA